MRIEDILARAKRSETTVSLCLDGPLVAEYERLEHEFRTASTKVMSLGDRAEASVIADRMAEIRKQMLTGEAHFLLRALPPREWADFFATLPSPGETDDEKATFDDRYYRWVCQLVADASVDPVMTVDQVDELVDALSNAQWQLLSDSAWKLNTSRQAIPFSVAASASTSAPDESSRPPGPGESPGADSSAPSGDQ